MTYLITKHISTPMGEFDDEAVEEYNDVSTDYIKGYEQMANNLAASLLSRQRGYLINITVTGVEEITDVDISAPDFLM